MFKLKNSTLVEVRLNELLCFYRRILTVNERGPTCYKKFTSQLLTYMTSFALISRFIPCVETAVGYSK